MRHLIIYGGTFDPVHFGHLKTAVAVENYFQFDQFIFLPAKASSLKSAPEASPEDRLKMLSLGLESFRAFPFDIDCREMTRDTPSYTVTTLKDFRKDYGNKLPITLLLGQDAFNQLPEWYEWESILKLANILVIHRPHIPKANFKVSETSNKETLLTVPFGKVMYFDAGSFEIASSDIRKALYEKKDVSNFIPAAVLNYIQENHLYIPFR